MIEEKLYSYGITAKYRGALISILLLVTLTVLIKLFDIDFPKTGQSLVFFIVFFSVFAISHIFWDFKILKNHKNVLLKNQQLIFYEGESNVSTLDLKDIAKIEEFPTADDIYDSDFIGNMMSAGMRLIAKDGKRYLIFTKISGFAEIKKVVSSAIKV